ncbi:MAG: SpoIVB peptidase [Clostridia bacterium]|nr:SpoIVB peptidase [Clostridia bacterium]
MIKKCVWKLLCCVLLISAVMLSCAAIAVGQSTQQKENSALSDAAIHTMSVPDTPVAAVGTSYATVESLPLIKTGTTLSPDALHSIKLAPGGMPFGVKFFTEGVAIVGFGEVMSNGQKHTPATDAGLRVKDVITAIDGESIRNAAHLTEAIEGCKGQGIELTCRRAGKEFKVRLTPLYSAEEGRYKTGIWVRDCGAGIGTVTFIVPETGAFAGLGHGICDADTGELIAMKRGVVSDVTISSVVRGTQGAPGELKGYFNAGKTGSLLGNSACGVWGVFSKLPACAEEPMSIALRDEIREGDAYILCTLDNNKICKYDVKISNINRDAKASKCFNVTITDPDLLAASGGIVQGMSGSPIIQNGKLVGAVTHVLINDPTTGYGIFIENMLNAAQMPMKKAS